MCWGSHQGMQGQGWEGWRLGWASEGLEKVGQGAGGRAKRSARRRKEEAMQTDPGRKDREGKEGAARRVMAESPPAHVVQRCRLEVGCRRQESNTEEARSRKEREQ